MADIGEGIVRIPTPLPFRPGSVNAYLVRLDAGGWMLVDGGLDRPDAWEALDAEVRRATGWSDLRLHVVSHMHVDHMGLVRRVRDASSIPLAMGLLDAERAAHAAAEPEEEDAYRQTLLARCGVPDHFIEALRETFGRIRGQSGFVPVDHDLPLPETDLPFAAEWRAIWTPGHTAGHISLFRQRDGVLIAGDAVLPTITPTIGVNRQREDPIADYASALQRLQSLGPASILPGHGEPLVGASRLGELLGELRAETDRILALVGPEPSTPWRISEQRYAGRDLPVPMQMQALRETLAHLEHLAGEQRVDRFDEDGKLRFASR